MNKIAGYSFFGLGVAALLLAGWLGFQTAQLFSNFDKVPAKIIQLEQGEATDARGQAYTEYLPVFTFNAVDGTSHTVTAKAGEGTPNRNAYRGRLDVTAIYEQGKESDARIVSFFGTWHKPLITLVSGLFCFSVAIAILMPATRKHQI